AERQEDSCDDFGSHRAPHQEPGSRWKAGTSVNSNVTPGSLAGTYQPPHAGNNGIACHVEILADRRNIIPPFHGHTRRHHPAHITAKQYDPLRSREIFTIDRVRLPTTHIDAISQEAVYHRRRDL